MNKILTSLKYQMSTCSNMNRQASEGWRFGAITNSCHATFRHLFDNASKNLASVLARFGTLRLLRDF
jgi:hypothetical protein